MLLLLAGSRPAQAATDPILQALEAMQPAQLQGGGDPHSFPQYQVYDRWPGGKPRTIVAAMLADSFGAREIAALRVAPGGSLRRLSTVDNDVDHIELRDVTGDGRAEVPVTGQPSRHSEEVDIFRWDGTTLTRIGEATDLDTFADIDGDGVPEIVDPNSEDEKPGRCADAIQSSSVQKLRRGKFVPATMPKAAFIVALTKLDIDREPFQRRFRLPDGVSRECRLHIVPGHLPPTGIRVGGVRIKGEEDIPMVFPSRCADLRVTLYGPIDASVVIVVEADRNAR